MPPSFSERLRDHTRDLHRAAERSPFMARLLAGRLDRAGYIAFLAQMQVMYAALETELDRGAHHPALAALRLPGLFRSSALAADLAVLRREHGPQPGVEPVAAAYAQRLHDLGRSHPERLLAHAYVRYLGDLSGGQMLRRVVARNPALGGGQGVAFYDFGDPLATRALTESFRAGLGAIRPGLAEADALVAEAQAAFVLHEHLFRELSADPVQEETS